MGKTLNLLTGKWIEEPKKRSNPEAKVGHAVDKYIESIGGYVRTIKSDGTKTATGWRKSAQGSGISDRLCWLESGQSLAIELKSPGRKSTLSDAQYRFLSKLLERGHRACVADSVDDVKKALASTIEECRLELDKWKPRTRSSAQELDLEPLFP
jgi:hypothetical protein